MPTSSRRPSGSTARRRWPRSSSCRSSRARRCPEPRPPVRPTARPSFQGVPVNVRPMLFALLACLPAALPRSAAAQGAGTRLLRHPAVSKDLVAFEYGGDLWTVSRAGGPPRRLPATPGVETEPQFSPDGSRIAFTATVAGNTDAYVVSAAGGDPKRLTWHPGPDRVRGWTPDGKSVVFGSARLSPPHHSYNRLWTVPADGGLEEPLPMPRAFSGGYSPDGRLFAYEEISTVMFPPWYETSEWRHYRGGRVHPIRVMNLADYSVEKLPWTDSNDSDPMWLGNTVYFLSDREFTTNLFSYSLDTKAVKQLTRHDDFDVMNASAGPDAVVYEQAGYLHLFDTTTGQARQLAIEVTGDFPWARPQFKKVAGMIRRAALSPTGVRVAFEARGDIFTVPAEKGDWRDLTKTTAVHEQEPVWSPDGTQLAWLSDASGEYQIMIGDQSGLGKPRAVPLPAAGFYSNLTWSPDGKQLALTDGRLSLWSLELATGKATRVDADTYDEPGRDLDPAWSPDSRWIAYSKSLDNHFRAIFVYSLAEGKAHQITDGMSDAVSPAFDASGKYLYFLASTDYGPRTAWVEMSSTDRPVRRAVYLAVLSASEPSPLLPETGDEPGPGAGEGPKAGGGAGGAGGAKSAGVDSGRLDFPGIGQRILSLGMPSADYENLEAGPAGTFFYTEPMGGGPGGGALRLQRYQLKERAAAPFLEGIRSYTLSGDRKKLLYRAPGADGGRWGIVPPDRKSPPLNSSHI